MSADSPRRSSGSATRGAVAVPAIVPPQVVSDRSILDSAIGFINEVTLAHQPPMDPKDTITWAKFETSADISDPCFGEDWELEGNVAPPLLLILGYGLGVQVWAIPANGEAVEVLSWRHGIVSAFKVLPTPLSTVADDENGRADEPIDAFGEKRPLIALVDGSSTSGSQPQFCAVNFISLKTGAQIKTIKFKNPVIDILANRSSVVITFHERIAVFDARTLEDRLSITTCYPSPGINPNPAALGPRWLAYAENKLLHSKRSGGGCDGDGVASYTATVLNASKSLVKGLRELGEQVAAGLTGTSGSTNTFKNASFDSGSGLDTKQSGIVTIIDIKNTVRDYSPTSGVPTSSNQTAGADKIIAHFIAHSEALVAMEFDNSGMILVTADRRGHDFHVFRIQPNPVGSSLAAVHHLYILHRGDTSAKVQNITLTLDSRWVAVSTLRGTTHVFPITPYGGAMGVRTHTSLHVVNKLSRFHRSAGLSAEGRSNSPISHSESTTFTQSLQPYYNSTLPPFPRPTVVMPLAQLRQPFALGSPPGSASITGVKSVASGSGSGSQRQRLSSLSDDNGKPLSVCATFAKSRSWLLDPPNVTREAPHRMQRKAVDSLFVMAGHGALIQYDLDTKLASHVAKEKICDDTPIELEVEAKAQWNLGRRKEGSQEIMPPLSPENWLIKNRNSCMLTDSTRQYDDSDERSESWLAQVEIITHAGPHRRLWMGPQFVFKTYNTPSGSNLTHVDIEAVEIGTLKSSTSTASEKIDHTSPLNMPLTAAGRSSAVPVLIESGSYSSIEQSPKLMDRFRHDHLDSDYSVAHGDSRLKEDLADAMRESPSAATSSKDAGGHVCESGGSSDNVAFYDALTAEDDHVYIHARSASAAALASVLPNIHSYDNSSSYESLDSVKKPKASIEKIVNPLGTVTTVNSCLTADVKTDILDEVVSQLAAEDTIIHENCDESLFRPVVAIFCDEKTLLQNEEEARKNNEKYQPPEAISSKLVVPVIAKEVDDELSKREKEKSCAVKSRAAVTKTVAKESQNLKELSPLNKEPKTNKKSSIVRGNMGADEKNSQKGKSLVFKVGSLPIADAYAKQETECVKKTSPSNEMSEEMKMVQTAGDLTTQVKSKKELCIQEKETKEQFKQPDIVPPTKTLPKTNTKKEAKMELEEYRDKNKVIDSSVKDISTKVETKSLDSNSQATKAKKNNTTKICKDSLDCLLGNDTSAELKSTATPPCKPYQIETNKIRRDNENASNNLKSNLPNNEKPPSNNSININTAIGKDKERINKGTIKARGPDANKVAMSAQHNVPQSADRLVETKNIEEKCTDRDLGEKKMTSNETENKSSTSSTNPFASEQKFESKNDMKEVLDASSSENPATTAELQGATKKTNDNCVELKKCEKNLEKSISQKQQNTPKIDVAFRKDLDLPTDEKAILNKKHLKEEKLISETRNPKNENIDKLLKIKSDDKPTKKSKDSLKYVKENCEEKAEEVDKTKKLTNRDKEEEKYEKNIKFDKTIKTDETGKSNIEDKKTHDCKFRILKTDNIEILTDTKPTTMEQDKSIETNKKSSLTLELKKSNKDILKCDLSDINPDTKTATTEIKINAPNSASPKKNGKAITKEELKKETDVSKKNPLVLTEHLEKKECHKDSLVKKDNAKEEKAKSKNDINKKTFGVSEKPSKLQNLPLPPTSAWKTLSGAEMINKKLSKFDSGKNNSDKLLPELPTPADVDEKTSFNEFSVLKSLDQLPPLPTLEPLQLTTENKSSSLRDISLITFESPLVENPTLQRKITPTPRGFTEQNLILALCGSLHYENEHTEKTEQSPTFSSNHSSTAFEETSIADYKSLTENDDPYISLEQSSQDTNTTNTNTTNEKFSSSTNSSGSEEIIIMEEKKMTKKQKRKRQQQLNELQKQKEQHHHQTMDDEELRPLIAMTDSQVNPTTIVSDNTLPTSSADNNNDQALATQTLMHSTTTDSEGPMPATTSDDNVFSIPVPIVNNPHKIKTKKLEHKINLIAAIEAATSSSTSSAEESGVELGGRSPQNNEESLISVADNISTSTIQPLPSVVATSSAVGALKKKTKRRKR